MGRGEEGAWPVSESRNYNVKILKRARKALNALPVQFQERVTAAISGLAADPRPPGCLRMSGVNSWRIRVGDYRVIYDIEDAVLTVLVIDLGHRREVYR
ncbi:type II toxin-antitoxin system RelE family toxin [Prosthecobacter sp.]